MPAIKFSDATISRITATDKTVWYSDVTYDGLRLAVGKKSKTFYYTKRHPDTKRVLTLMIGRYPATDYAHAKIKAGELFKQIVEHRIDPAAVKKAREANTLQATLDAYIRARTNSKKLSSKCAQDYRDILRIHASDWLPLPLHKITTRDFEERFIEMSDKPYAANKFTRIMRQLFAYAQRHDPSVRSPALVVEYHPEHKRTPKTGSDWGAHLKNILAVENIVRRNAWLLLWLTGIRSTNLRTLTWEDVDLDERTVHLKKMKNGRARTLPLSDISVALFKQLRPLDKTYCFPSFKRRGPIDHLDTLDTGRQHDMRHLFVTAAGLCHLPEYMIAFLKGDVVEQSMVQRYFDDLGEHAASDAISRKILERCGVLPEAFLGLIASDRITSASPSPTSSADPRTGEAALALRQPPTRLAA
jgi:integrase